MRRRENIFSLKMKTVESDFTKTCTPIEKTPSKSSWEKITTKYVPKLAENHKLIYA